MRSQIFHAPLLDEDSRAWAWVQLEKLTDDGDIGTGYIIKAIVFLISLAAATAFLLCVFNPAVMA